MLSWVKIQKRNNGNFTVNNLNGWDSIVLPIIIVMGKNDIMNKDFMKEVLITVRTLQIFAQIRQICYLLK